MARYIKEQEARTDMQKHPRENIHDKMARET